MRRAVAFLLFSTVAWAQAPSADVARELGAAAAKLAPGQPATSPMFATTDAEGGGFMVGLTGGVCYTFVGAGARTVGDVALELYDVNDKRVGVDARRDRWAEVRYCAAVTANHRIQLAARSGRGEVAFQVFQAPRTAAPTASAPPPPGVPPPLSPPPPPPAPSRPPPPRDPLAAEVTRLAGPLTVAVPPIAGPAPSLPLQSGQCYVVITAGAQVHKLRALLYSPTGRKVAASRMGATDTRLFHCARETGPYKLKLQGDGPDDAVQFRTGVYYQLQPRF